MSMSDHEDASDDDEMADLFSFSTASTPVKEKDVVQSLSASQNDLVISNGEDAGEENVVVKENGDSPEEEEEDDDYLFGPKPASSGRVRTSTTDSVLNLLENEDSSPQLHDDDDDDDEDHAPTSPTDVAIVHSNDTQEILDWLDKDKDKPSALDPPDSNDSPTTTTTTNNKPLDPPDSSSASSTNNNDAPSQQNDDASNKKKPDLPEYGTPFETLREAANSPQATLSQIRRLFVQEGFTVQADCRAALWCRAVCGKTLEQILESSVADSFCQWREEDDSSTEGSCRPEYNEWMENESSVLANRIVTVLADVPGTEMAQDEAQQELLALLQFHYQSKSSSENEKLELDPLLPPVACALLSAGIPTAAASVVLSNIVPAFMPLLALDGAERLEAAKSLHQQFYLLAVYHLPLLVHHLDRYAPGWHYPKVTLPDTENDNATARSRNLQNRGAVPQSWFLSHLAGECDGSGTLMNPKWLVSLWDLILTSSNNSLRFFFSLALLEKHSDSLLMMTGEALLAELNRIMEFKEETTLEGFAIEDESDSHQQEAVDEVQEWCATARGLWESTPKSVVSQLRQAEDEAVRAALQKRTQLQQEAMEAKLQEERQAHELQLQQEKEARLEEFRRSLTRSRLVEYYKKYNPEKEDTVDKILETFDGRLDVLDAKLKKKYGVGFNPVLKPNKMSKKNNKLVQTMNQWSVTSRQRVAAALTTKKKDDAAYNIVPAHQHHQVVTVSPTEVLPILCWSRESSSSLRKRQQDETENMQRRVPLKFFLMDCRSSDICQEQGRFPTAVNICPETLVCPDQMEQHEEMFESLRGAVHICVMGEGFSAIPTLYGQNSQNTKLQELTKEDESRTSLCALFLVKKGFPFVSILDGGFAAAHAWLAREGPNRHLAPSTALVDYDQDVSLLAQLENAHKNKEDTTRAMQNLLDGSLASLMRSQMRLENLASELESEKERRRRKSVTSMFSKKQQQQEEDIRQSVSDIFTSKKQEENDIIRQSVSNIFSKKPQESEEESRDNKEEVEPPADGESSLFSNTFASVRKSILKKKDGDEEEVTSATEGQTEEGTAATARFQNIFAKKSSIDKKDEEEPEHTEPVMPQSPLAKLKQVATSITEEFMEDSERDVAAAAAVKRNRFGGFGSALNSMAARTAEAQSSSVQPKPAMLKRNPFARFGGTTKAEESNDGPKVNRFAGLGQFRRRVQQQSSSSKPEENTAASSTEASEESISFFDNDVTANVEETSASAAAPAVFSNRDDKTDA